MSWGGIDGRRWSTSAPFTNAVQTDVAKMAEADSGARSHQDGDHQLNPFTGPINKQDGSPWLADGVTAPDGDLLGMSFYVEGITGDIPK